MIGHLGHLLWEDRTMDTSAWAIAKWSLEDLGEGEKNSRTGGEDVRLS